MRKIAVICFLVPSLAGFLIFFLIPFIGSFGYAFSNGSFMATIQNPAFQTAMGNTFRFMIIVVPLNLILPLLIAIAVKSLGEKGRIFQVAYISPMVVPVASVALFWSILFSKGGTMNQLLAFAGLGSTDLMSGVWTVGVVALITVWKNLGYMMILYLAGLSEIPKSYYESADMEGANGLQKFFHVTLPSLRPTIFLVFVMCFVNSFKVFRELYLLWGPYPDNNIYMLQHFMNNMFSNGDNGRLTAAALIVAAVIVVVLLIAFLLNNRAQKKLER